MKTVRDYLQERARRRAVDDKIVAHLRARFEFTKDSRHRLRRQEVYRSCIEHVGENYNNEMIGRVFDACEKLGAVGISPKNIRMFAKMRARPQDQALPEPAETDSPAARAALKRAWYAQLTREGLGIEKDGGAPRLPRFDQFRAQVNGAVIDMAVSHYWMMRRELEIWGYYAIDGISIRDISARTGHKFEAVRDVITRMRAAMDRFGHPTPNHETWDEEG